MNNGDTYGAMESALSNALNGVDSVDHAQAFAALQETYAGDYSPDATLTAYAAKQTGHYLQDHGNLKGWGHDGDPRCAMGAAGSAIFSDVNAYGGVKGAVVTFRAFVNALVHDDLQRLKRYEGKLGGDDTSTIMHWNDALAQTGEVATRCFKLARRLLRRPDESAPVSFAEVTDGAEMAPIGFAEVAGSK